MNEIIKAMQRMDRFGQSPEVPTRVSVDERKKAKRSLELALSQGFSTGGWSTDHREEARQFVGWHYVAINAIGVQFQQATVNAYSPEVEPQSQLKGYAEKEDKGQPLEPEHPLLKVCKRPNPKQSGASFRYEQAMQLHLTGKCMVWNQKNAWGKVIRRYILPTAIAEPRTPTDEYPEGYYRIKPELSRIGSAQGWFFAGSHLPSVGWHLDAREVQTYLKPHAVFRDDGQSPVAASALWTDSARAIDVSRMNHLDGPDPTLVVSGDFNTSDENELERLRSKFNLNYAGVDNHGRAIFIDARDGVNIETLSVNPKDMQYSEGFEQVRDSILAVHGVPKIAAGLEAASGHDGLYAPLEQFVTLVVQPALDLIAEEDNASWVYQFGDGVYLEYIAKEVGERQKSREDFELAMSAKILTKGDACDLLGFERFGDERDEELAGESPQQMMEGMGPGMPGMPGMEGEEKPDEESDPFGFGSSKMLPAKNKWDDEKKDEKGNTLKPKQKSAIKQEIVREITEVILKAAQDARK